jgi:hypothetical protein
MLFHRIVGTGRVARPKGRLQQTQHATLHGEPLECRLLLAVDVTSKFTVTEDWGSGFQGSLKLTSHQAAAITPWRLEFDWSANITSIWNAQIESRVGQHYTIVGAPWNNALPGGGAVEFGFVANPGGAPQGPKNLVLNGSPLGGTTPVLPTLSIEDVSVTEGNSGTRNANFTLRLSSASSQPVSVTYRTANGTATAGSDYQAASGTVHFAPGHLTQGISVVVNGDQQVEDDETLLVQLSQPVGATLARTQAVGTILNDDVSTQPAGVEFEATSNWGTGFVGNVTVRNAASQPITDWRVQFDFAGEISTIWNGVIESRQGNRYVIRHAGYNSSIPGNSSTSFGFVGNTTNGTLPTNLQLVGTQPPENRAPVAANDLAVTTIGQQVLIDVLANDSDPDGDAISLIAAQGASHGTVAVQDGLVRYTPAAGFIGSDSFSYQIRDARGLSATATVNVTVRDVVAAADQMFAPYVDMTLWPTYDLVAAARTANIKYFTLAFITADPQNRPAWGGYAEYALGSEFDAKIKAQINGVRALGGDVIVSFGGAANKDLAEVITNVASLQAAYQSIIDAYGLTHIDFDIEGGAIAHRDSVDRRNLAIAGLQQAAAAAGRTLHVSYTLPVLPTGLTPDGVYLLESAKARGVQVDVVNIMAMDYGDSAAPNPQGRMGDYAIQAANSLFNQLRGVHGTSKTDDELWQMVGITPMIGINDVTSEIFDQQEAREVLAFAEQRGIGRLSFWSLNRDRQSPNGVLNYVDLMSSSILQSPFEFSQIFGAFDD